MLAHLERVASCPHDSPINLGLPLQTSKGDQRAAISIPYHMPIKHIVQLRWRPAILAAALKGRGPEQRTRCIAPFPGKIHHHNVGIF